MQGQKYMLLGLVLIVVVLYFLINSPDVLQVTVNVLIGSLMLGLLFFGLIFLFVAIEEMKSGMQAKSEETQAPSEEKPKAKKK